MDELLKERTLKTLDGLPPLEHLFASTTEDQVAAWKQAKTTFAWLRESFKDYFSGQPSKHDLLSPRDQEFLGLLRDFYLTWYTAIQWGWSHIQQDIHKRGLDVNDYAATPGDALIQFLENSADAVMQPSRSGYYRFTPHNVRELVKSERQVNSIINRRNEPPTETESEVIKKHWYKVAQSSKEFEPYFNFYESTVRLLESVKRDTQLKKYIKEHLRAKDDLDAFIQSECNPKRKRKGFEYKNGLFSLMDKHGGKPS
ncbi:hypothetical protein [Nostoc sp. FACHB-190]|uniref:hypothetical protein n=1 Tax=Nostoc sp. FACHB-190 TaxID=2692838 RepID=UPI001682D92D|nr:hypothetical protein [Nostoc sp. FACHB-190]MBD2298951.1 hypothetical protein [Nostoc sp. FACHB-190]